MTWKLLCGALFASALSFACTDPTGTASAAVTDPTSADGGSGARPPRPPQQSIDACATSNEGDACAFEIDGHHVTGTCSHGPDGGGPLACKPDHPPQPPQAAIDACASKADGDACSFTCPTGDNVDGTCTTTPDGSTVVCAPDGGPPPV